ncbi:hypothetical protein [Burkholderia contaminans]|uniref:hypothetical protein n=1 Tax=Burkholderia contaminans TaxID=488447 RepID=UPI00115FB374|nr:hypothetical protein [Burkholderia contaminans]
MGAHSSHLPIFLGAAVKWGRFFSFLKQIVGFVANTISGYVAIRKTTPSSQAKYRPGDEMADVAAGGAPDRASRNKLAWERPTGRPGTRLRLLWGVVAGGNLVGLVALLFLPLQAITAATLGALSTFLVMAPFIHFLTHGWYDRYDEFRNSLKDDALFAYLQRFWSTRLLEALRDYADAGVPFNERASQMLADKGGEKDWTILKDAARPYTENVFRRIYLDQYGLSAFIAPFLFILIITYLNSLLVTLENSCTASAEACFLYIGNAPAPVVISALSGAYMFTVADSVTAIRRRSLNVSDMYWYGLRQFLAIPIAEVFAGAAGTAAAGTGAAAVSAGIAAVNAGAHAVAAGASAVAASAPAAVTGAAAVAVGASAVATGASAAAAGTSLAAAGVATAASLSFAVALLPIDVLLKVIRRFALVKLSINLVDEQGDQLLKLSGMTSPLVVGFLSEGVYSIEQVACMDPIVLAIRTGLPFRLILRFGAQAIVRRHFGDSADKLADIGFSDAIAFYDVLNRPPTCSCYKEVCSTIQKTIGKDNTTLPVEVVDMKVRHIVGEGYTQMLAKLSPLAPEAKTRQCVGGAPCQVAEPPAPGRNDVS